MQTDVSFRHLEKAVLAPAVAVGPTVAAVAELDRVPGLQIGGAGGASAGGGVSSMSLFQEDPNASTMQTDVSFRHLEKAVLAPAVAVGPTVAAVAELDRVPGLQIGGAGGASAGGRVSSMSLFQEDATVSRIFGAVLLPTHGFSGDCLAAALRSPHSL